jgi:hypothetical protein
MILWFGRLKIVVKDQTLRSDRSCGWAIGAGQVPTLQDVWQAEADFQANGCAEIHAKGDVRGAYKKKGITYSCFQKG